MSNRLFAVVTAASLAAGCSGDAGTPAPPGTGALQRTRLRFTAIPDQNTTELQEKFRPLSEHLTHALGVGVEYIAARDYQAAVEMFVNGDAGLAWFGGLTGVQARNKVPGARAIAQGDLDYSYFIANQSPGLNESETFPADIRKYSFTFGAEQSTLGPSDARVLHPRTYRNVARGVFPEAGGVLGQPRQDHRACRVRPVRRGGGECSC
jgi:phosphonate transport system substrate-binding protein